MISEFERWGYANQRMLIGSFQLIGGAGLTFGSLFVISSDNIGGEILNSSNILCASSLLLTILMVGAIFVRISIKDKFVNVLPAAFYAILNFIVFYNTIG